MTTFDKNALRFHYQNALQDFQEAKEKEELDFYPVELTMERIEADGFIQGYENGALAGYRHAIALLQAEGFTEQALILSDQLKNLDAIFNGGDKTFEGTITLEFSITNAKNAQDAEALINVALDTWGQHELGRMSWENSDWKLNELEAKD